MKSLAIASLLAMASLTHSELGEFYPRPRRKRETRNKYNLKPEQIEAMETMSPKEKKKFLRGLNEPSA